MLLIDFSNTTPHHPPSMPLSLTFVVGVSVRVAAAIALLFGIQLTGICILSIDTLCHYIFGIYPFIHLPSYQYRLGLSGRLAGKTKISSAKSTIQAKKYK